MGEMITAIVLSHNDENTIERTLTSIAFCDERIVIDDFSGDKTTDIAASLGVKVYQRQLKNNFAAQRNFGLTKATGEWVLFIDSDEVVSRALATEIQKALTIDCAGFYIRRTDWLFGKKLLHGETGKVRLLRLAKKGAGSWERPVHEVWKIKGFIGELTNALDHFPHPNVAQFIDEINTYSTINAHHLYSKGIKSSFWHILAYPVAKFFVDYFWYLGFLDGTAGAVVALAMSFHSFLTRSKLWLLWHKHEAS